MAGKIRIDALSALRLRYRELLRQPISEASSELTPEEVPLVLDQTVRAARAMGGSPCCNMWRAVL